MAGFTGLCVSHLETDFRAGEKLPADLPGGASPLLENIKRNASAAWPWKLKRKRLLGFFLHSQLLLVSAAVMAGPQGLNTTCTLDIHERSLVDALNELARQCHMQALYPFNLVGKDRAYTLKGGYSVADALKILLQDTSLSGNVTASGYITVSQPTITNNGGEEMIQSRNNLVGIIAGMLGFSAVAASTMAQEHTGGNSGGIDEIIVTAQKRDQSLQDVPISISAMSESFLEKSGVTNPEDLNVAVPGLNVTRQLSSMAPIIRGVGNYNAAPGAEGAVATYVDNMYMADSYGALLSFVNIERVEVLRGPQGTLFGRNSTGGLIHIITKDPEHEAGGKASVGYGSNETMTAKFYGTTGLSESVAMDISAYYRDQGNGFGENIGTGSDTIFLNEFAARTKVLIQPSDTTRIVLSADVADTESDLGVMRRSDDGTVDFFGNSPLAGYYDFNQPHDHVSDNRQWGLSGRLEQGFASFDLVANLSYRDLEADLSGDIAYAPVPFIFTDLPAASETYTAEVQLVSNGENNLKWIAGVYYLGGEAGLHPFELSGAGVLGLTGGQLSVISRTNVQDTESASIFGEMSYPLGDNTNLTAGGRYTEDKRDYSSRQRLRTAGGAVLTPPEISKSKTFREPTWRVILDHSLASDTMIYVSYSRGFKSGIFSTNADPATNEAVNPELLDAYEAGFKSEFMDSRVRLNGSAFFYQYDDLQLTTQVNNVSVLRNAAEAEMYGFELELFAMVSDTLDVNASLAWLDSEFIDFPGAELSVANPTRAPCPNGARFPNCTSFGNAKGNEVPRAPDLTYSLGVSYETDLANSTFGANVTVYYNAGSYNDFANRYEKDSYTLVNASTYLGFGASQQYRARLFARNLGDEEYYSFATATQFGDQIAPALGREVGLELEYEF